MWIVRIALDRPYTFIVYALLILILSPVVILRTPTDIFPNINIPVVTPWPGPVPVSTLRRWRGGLPLAMSVLLRR
jgi:multidrug efflux pump subunit AcrB